MTSIKTPISSKRCNICNEKHVGNINMYRHMKEKHFNGKSSMKLQGWLWTRSHQNWKYKAPKVIMKLIFLKKLNNLDFHNVFQIPLKIMYHKHCYQNSCWYICIVPCFKQKNSRYKKCRTFLYNPCQLSIDWKPFEKRKDHICCDIFFASKSKIPDNIQVK